MHADDVPVEWNGEVTDGYAAHETVLRSVTQQHPDLKVTAHPIKVADGEWTATVGELTGGGKMMTLARWRDGAISEEHLRIPGSGERRRQADLRRRRGRQPQGRRGPPHAPAERPLSNRRLTAQLNPPVNGSLGPSDYLEA